MLVENRQFEPTTPLFGAPLGVIPLEFHWDFGIRKLQSPCAIVWRCCSSFSHFGTVLACGRQTTDG